MSAWRISTDACPSVERSAVWQQAMDRLYLPSGSEGIKVDPDFHGDVSSILTPQGIEFSRVRASPHRISGRTLDQPYSVWLAILIEGQFSMQQEHRLVPVKPGDIIYGPTGTDATLQLQSDYQMLYVKLPRGLLHPRLVNPTTLPIGCLPAHEGVNSVFANMLVSVSQNIDNIDSSLLRPVEIALTEFVVTSLAQQTMMDAFGSTAKLVHYQRICQSIDGQLGDPDLNLGQLAEQQHVSPRYIQKLFEAAGTNFGHYVRLRRLERCRCELENPQYGHLSISDICFRWGFNDAAHFSRTFRNEFGMTPRACRQAASSLADGIPLVAAKPGPGPRVSQWLSA